MELEKTGVNFIRIVGSMTGSSTTEKRSHILEKTLILFKEKGYYGISVADIAQACGMARGSLYTYFESKQELVNELYVMWKERLFEYVCRGIQGRAVDNSTESSGKTYLILPRIIPTRSSFSKLSCTPLTCRPNHLPNRSISIRSQRVFT